MQRLDLTISQPLSFRLWWYNLRHWFNHKWGKAKWSYGALFSITKTRYRCAFSEVPVFTNVFENQPQTLLDDFRTRSRISRKKTSRKASKIRIQQSVIRFLLRRCGLWMLNSKSAKLEKDISRFAMVGKIEMEERLRKFHPCIRSCYQDRLTDDPCYQTEVHQPRIWFDCSN